MAEAAELADQSAPKKGRPGPKPRTDWQEPFLEQFGSHGVQAWAAKTANISADTVAEERKRNPAFAKEYDAAFELSTAVLERRAVQWASAGIPTKTTTTRTETKTDKAGNTTTHTVTTVTESADASVAMMIFLLKSRRPDVYRDRIQVEQTGEGGGPVEIRVSKEEMDAAARGFNAEVVRLADARRARDSAQSSSAG